jgi:hypothetical protein
MFAFLDTYGFLIVSMLLGALLGLSVYLPLMAGQLSLASPGFYALGGYIAAILSTQVFPASTGDFPLFWLLLEMLLAALVSAVVAIVLGIPVLRLRGIYRNFAGAVAQPRHYRRSSGHFWHSSAVSVPDWLFVAGGSAAAAEYGVFASVRNNACRTGAAGDPGR